MLSRSDRLNVSCLNAFVYNQIFGTDKILS
uniref:Uncharacterized protein n=1 Tax=Lotus japonicus TaxID=34305 RepID=I3S054_LOTJA|nr:unknown [Lotus japonicus]